MLFSNVACVACGTTVGKLSSIVYSTVSYLYTVHTHAHTISCVPTRKQAVSSLLDVLVEQYECSCSQTDIQRMELIVMQKLEFRITPVTPLDFLKIVSLQLSAMPYL